METLDRIIIVKENELQRVMKVIAVGGDGSQIELPIMHLKSEWNPRDVPRYTFTMGGHRVEEQVA